MIRPSLACLLVLSASCAAQTPAAPPVAEQLLTLEQIMADPDWIGNAPEAPYWADDGQSIYYSVKRPGSEARDLIQVGFDGTRLRVVADADKGLADTPGGDWTQDFRGKVYSRAGDLFLKDIATGTVTQLTRTAESETAPRFMVGDRRVVFRRGVIIVRDLDTGQEFQPADLQAADDPDKKKDEDADFLKSQQERLFDTVKERKRRQDEAKELEKAERDADATRPAKPWYFGADMEIRDSSLSPAGRWMLVQLVKKGSQEGKRDAMPQYVSETGYVESRSVRSKVGTGKPAGESLVLLDLEKGERKDLDLAALPGIADDPLKDLRDAAEKRRKEEKAKKDAANPEETKEGDKEKSSDAPGSQPDVKSPEGSKDEKKGDKKDEKPKPRPIGVRDIAWSDDGSRLVLQVFSHDNKDRWIAAVDLEGGKLVPLERDTDEAWINGRFTSLGWLKDNRTIWFLSERAGYSHLYLRDTDTPSPHTESPPSPASSARSLTRGHFEVDDVRLARDGKRLFYSANAHHPGEYETWVLDVESGEARQLTALQGVTDFVLSPDARNLMLYHSSATRPPELYIQPAESGATPRRITTTVSEAFAAIPWRTPQFVEIPGRAGPIYARLYLPSPAHLSQGRRGDLSSSPAHLRSAVLFIHGAGYLQNAHKGWSRYFREMMFHNLLAQRGYVVLDMDYRASSGYGRDWRMAIYRRMGTPEVEDLEDGVKWLAEHHSVDPARVGCYGGSYGGFLTLMALFTKPDLFACGAALRPVTDWAHYSDGYTENILNTPEVDPEAYERSSPIEYAAGLKNPLLICHGMQDDNVFFQDTVRLAQRLIELKKENWEVAMYPIEPHAFQEPTSWLDEYRRVLKLFEMHLGGERQDTRGEPSSAP